jgi:hypothetical protein
MGEKIENIKSWWKWNVTYKWYDFRRGVKNLWNYKKVVWNTGDFDYAYILRMQKFQLERLLKVLENGNEVDEYRLPKVEDIKRCIELINNQLEDNFAERCGYDTSRHTMGFTPIDETLDGEKLFKMVNTNPNPQSDKEMTEIFAKARELEKKEWDELWDTIKNGNKSNFGLNSWWD